MKKLNKLAVLAALCAFGALPAAAGEYAAYEAGKGQFCQHTQADKELHCELGALTSVLGAGAVYTATDSPLLAIGGGVLAAFVAAEGKERVVDPMLLRLGKDAHPSRADASATMRMALPAAILTTIGLALVDAQMAAQAPVPGRVYDAYPGPEAASGVFSSKGRPIMDPRQIRNAARGQ